MKSSKEKIAATTRCFSKFNFKKKKKNKKRELEALRCFILWRIIAFAFALETLNPKP